MSVQCRIDLNLIPLKKQVNVIWLARAVHSLGPLEEKFGISEIYLSYIISHQEEILKRWLEATAARQIEETNASKQEKWAFEAIDGILFEWTKRSIWNRMRSIDPCDIECHASQLKKELGVPNFHISIEFWNALFEFGLNPENKSRQHYALQTICILNDIRHKIQASTYKKFLDMLEKGQDATNAAQTEESVRITNDVENMGDFAEVDDNDVILLEQPIECIDVSHGDDEEEMGNASENNTNLSKLSTEAIAIKVEPDNEHDNEKDECVEYVDISNRERTHTTDEGENVQLSVEVIEIMKQIEDEIETEHYTEENTEDKEEENDKEVLNCRDYLLKNISVSEKDAADFINENGINTEICNDQPKIEVQDEKLYMEIIDAIAEVQEENHSESQTNIFKEKAVDVISDKSTNTKNLYDQSEIEAQSEVLSEELIELMKENDYGNGKETSYSKNIENRLSNPNVRNSCEVFHNRFNRKQSDKLIDTEPKSPKGTACILHGKLVDKDVRIVDKDEIEGVLFLNCKERKNKTDIIRGRTDVKENGITSEKSSKKNIEVRSSDAQDVKCEAVETDDKLLNLLIYEWVKRYVINGNEPPLKPSRILSEASTLKNKLNLPNYEVNLELWNDLCRLKTDLDERSEEFKQKKCSLDYADILQACKYAKRNESIANSMNRLPISEYSISKRKNESAKAREIQNAKRHRERADKNIYAKEAKIVPQKMQKNIEEGKLEDITTVTYEIVDDCSPIPETPWTSPITEDFEAEGQLQKDVPGATAQVTGSHRLTKPFKSNEKLSTPSAIETGNYTEDSFALYENQYKSLQTSEVHYGSMGFPDSSANGIKIEKEDEDDLDHQTETEIEMLNQQQNNSLERDIEEENVNSSNQIATEAIVKKEPDNKGGESPMLNTFYKIGVSTQAKSDNEEDDLMMKELRMETFPKTNLNDLISSSSLYSEESSNSSESAITKLKSQDDDCLKDSMSIRQNVHKSSPIIVHSNKNRTEDLIAAASVINSEEFDNLLDGSEDEYIQILKIINDEEENGELNDKQQKPDGKEKFRQNDESNTKNSREIEMFADVNDFQRKYEPSVQKIDDLQDDDSVHYIFNDVNKIDDNNDPCQTEDDGNVTIYKIIATKDDDNKNEHKAKNEDDVILISQPQIIARKIYRISDISKGEIGDIRNSEMESLTAASSQACLEEEAVFCNDKQEISYPKEGTSIKPLIYTSKQNTKPNQKRNSQKLDDNIKKKRYKQTPTDCVETPFDFTQRLVPLKEYFGRQQGETAFKLVLALQKAFENPDV